MPNLLATHPNANEFNSFDLAVLADKEFARDCCKGTINNINRFQQRVHTYLVEQLHTLPNDYTELPIDAMIKNATDVNAIRSQTERLLWHQRLGHTSDDRLYTAHKFVDGVPKFKHFDPILEKCPTCIRSKQTKEPAGPNTTRRATRPFQGLSIDFGFSGVKSKNKERRKDYIGLKEKQVGY